MALARNNVADPKLKLRMCGWSNRNAKPFRRVLNREYQSVTEILMADLIERAQQPNAGFHGNHLATKRRRRRAWMGLLHAALS